MSLRALSSDGQSTSLTRKGSAVQVRQRPRSSLTSAPSCGQRPLFARDTGALKGHSADAAETQQADAAAIGSNHKQRAESVPAVRAEKRKQKQNWMETESKKTGNSESKGLASLRLLEQPGSARLSPGPLYPADCRCNYYIRIMPILLLVIPERGRASR